MKTMYRLLLMMFAVFCFSACDKLASTFGDSSDYDFLSELLGDKPEKMKAHEITFSPDYKTFTMTTDIIQDIGPYALEDSAEVRKEVEETIDGIREAKFSTPRIVKIKNIESERIYENDIRLLVLVDLTLPQSSIDQICSNVREIKKSFNHDNLFVAFMDGPNVSNTLKVTDYVLDHHFKKSDNKFIYLYQSILKKRSEMIQGEEFWQDAHKLVMLIFSDEKVYDNETDEPIDPEHYQYEEQMVKVAADTNSNFSAFYASLNPHQVADDDHDEKVLMLFCYNSGGSFMRSFNWVSCENTMLNTNEFQIPDYELYFENPDYKVYRGDRKRLTVNFYDIKTDSLIASVSQEVVLGEIFDPIIVNGPRLLYVLLQGLFIGMGLLLLVYLIFQFIVPFIKYRFFHHKYVVQYTGQNMCFHNNPVEESC